MSDLKQALLNKGYTEAQADKEIAEAKRELIELIEDGQAPFDYCLERWNLEPDYLEDLLF